VVEKYLDGYSNKSLGITPKSADSIRVGVPPHAILHFLLELYYSILISSKIIDGLTTNIMKFKFVVCISILFFEEDGVPI
jgi:hypothetical protein